MEENRIDVDFGYRIETKGEPTRYYEGQTAQGYAYKDSAAFKTGSGICYIPECELDDDNGTRYANKYGGYKREDFIDFVTTVFKEYFPHLSPNDHIDFILYVAEHVFETVDWQHPLTYLGEWTDKDWEEMFEYFNSQAINLKVWRCYAKAHYGGGMILVAARNEDEAIEAAAKDKMTGIWFDRFDENGCYTHDSSGVAKSDYFPKGDWKEIPQVQTTITEPKVICASIYIE